MTVNELISKLQSLSDYGECRVIVRGYEGGVDDVDHVIPALIQIDEHKGMNYYGAHGVKDVEDIRYDAKYDDEHVKYENYAHAIFIKHGVL